MTLLLDGHCSKTINDNEFLLLYDINLCSNLHLPHWKYDRFSLEDMNNDECKAEYMFLREDIYNSRNVHMLQWCKSNRNRRSLHSP